MAVCQLLEVCLASHVVLNESSYFSLSLISPMPTGRNVLDEQTSINCAVNAHIAMADAIKPVAQFLGVTNVAEHR
ncbi:MULTISPECIES: hypothetical protein [Bradyrhizobium]|uniref:hypothetical protein n=1 Tax=Bradyrhizobium pachyrhizi TaxID=280333 RepID=UPI002AA54B55